MMKAGSTATGMRIGCWHFAATLLFFLLGAFAKGGFPIRHGILYALSVPAVLPLLFLHGNVFKVPGVSLLSAALLDSLLVGLAAAKIHAMVRNKKGKHTQPATPPYSEPAVRSPQR